MIRVSYSILSAWERGDYRSACASYLHIEQPTSLAMQTGKIQHEKISKYIQRNKKLPKILGYRHLSNPICENKQEVMINPEIKLVFIPDCVNEETLYEWKFGTTEDPISRYMRSKQVEVYSLALSKMNYLTNRAEYLYINLPRKEVYQGIIHLTDARRKMAEEWIVENATSFKDYLVQNNLLLTNTK